jgi:hypothetical protein
VPGRAAAHAPFSLPDAENVEVKILFNQIIVQHKALLALFRDKLTSHQPVLELVKTRQFATFATLYAES